MHNFESFARNQAEKSPPDDELATIDDFADAPQIQQLLRRLPNELQSLHATKIIDLPEEEAFAYMHALLENRESAIRESVVSDEVFAHYFHEHETEIWRDLETRVFNDEDNYLGAGQTARIKQYDIHDPKAGKDISLAIKYLLTPTTKTLSVSGEHDLIKEVERVRAIERVEKEVNERDLSLRVPHPYFYYKNGKTQCYGMERIDGINLEQGISGDYDSDLKQAFKESLATIDRAKLDGEIDQFYEAMHMVCLHGDIKPANIMVSREGRFYIIDLGQSVLTNDIDEKSRDAFEVLKQDEKDNTRSAIRYFFTSLFEE